VPPRFGFNLLASASLIARLTDSGAAVSLLFLVRFLPLFLALWLLTFFGPHLFAIVADLFLQVVRVIGSPMAADIGMWVVWVGLVPAAYAWAQWLLMRRCISTAVAWGLAVLIGQVLARLGTALIDDIDPRQSELTFQVFMALADALGDAVWVQPVHVMGGQHLDAAFFRSPFDRSFRARPRGRSRAAPG
jgi:hypothetical protein